MYYTYGKEFNKKDNYIYIKNKNIKKIMNMKLMQLLMQQMIHWVRLLLLLN